MTDPLGHETLYTYDARGDVLTKTVNAQDAPNSEVTTYTYDADGNQLSKTVSYKTTSATWTSTYDALDRIATMQAPGVANPTTYAYDQVGQLVQGDPGFLTSAVTTPDGVQTTTTENYRGDVVDTQRGTQGTPLAPTTTKYDAADRATSITDPNGNTVSYTYDGWGDKLSETSPSGATSYTTPLQAGASVVTAYVYDAVGDLASTSVDSKNTPYTQTYTYDGLGDVLSTTAPAPTTGTATWNFTYDAAGQQVEQTDPNGHATDETYNQLGQLASTTTYPSSSLTLTTTYAYDADGNLSEKTPPATDTPAAPSQCFTYDEYNNLASRYTVPNGDACTYAPQLNTDAYTTNPISGMTSAVDTPTGQTTTITYDPQNPTRVSQVAENGATSAYTYDPNSGLLATSNQTLGSTSNQTSYTYDAYGRIQAITDPFTNKQTTYTYTPANQVATVTQPTGLVTTYAYDTAERLLSETTKNGAATVLEYGQNYNDFSQVTELDETYPTISGQTQSGDYAYQYNPAQELSQAKYTPSGGSTQTTNYAYDLAGNRTQVAVVGGTTTNYTYDHAGRLTTDGTNTYTWNAIDQMTAAGSTSYAYTPWGSLTSATTPSQTITYTPDALNRTTTRAVQGGQTTTYTYDGTSNTTTSEQVGSATPTYYAPGLNAPLAQQNGTTTRYYQQDPHGDLTLFTDASGNPTASISYDPWGMPTALGSDATQSLLSYQSQPTDPTTGLVQMGARAYDPSLGQFTSQDSYGGTPSDPLTLNQYTYAGDSPIDNPDLNGHRFACTSTCTAAQSVLNNGIYDAGQAINRGDPLAAVGYVAQAVTWLKQAAAAPVPKPAAAKPILMPGGLTHCAVCIQSSSYQLGNWNQEMTVAARGPSLLQTGILALGIVLTPITDGGSDVVAGELDAALAVDEAATAETASSGGGGRNRIPGLGPRLWIGGST